MFIGNSLKDVDGKAEFSVLVEGRSQLLYRRLGDGKVFVAGAPGMPYVLRVKNLTDGRIEAVVAIDQRNVLKDEPVKLGTTRGMIIGAGRQYDFQGWRIDDNNVGQFEFATPPDAVAAQATNSVGGVGIIGFAIYTEQSYSYRPRRGGFEGGSNFLLGDAPRTPSRMGGVLEGASARGVEERHLGTGIGDTVADSIGHTSFDRAPGNPSVTELGYNVYEVLDAMGLIRPGEPVAFPAASTATGYQKYQRPL